MGRHERWLAAVAVFASVSGGLVGCGGGGGGGGRAQAPTTAWNAVVDQFNPDGSVGVDAARQAFALVVAPLPGVQAPQGARPQLHSVSGPVRWLLANWHALTDDQRAAAAAVIDPPGTGRSAGAPRSRGGPTLISHTVELASDELAPYVALADEAEGSISGHLGRSLGVKPEIVLQDKPDKSVDPAFESYTRPSDAAGGQTGPMTRCVIHLVRGQVEAKSAAFKRGVVAHEVMHCFIYARLALNESMALPGWVAEGIPAWVGETLAGGTAMSEDWWQYYLTHPYESLFKIAYSALGFYSHMAEVGSDPWTQIDAIVKAAAVPATGSVAAYGLATASGGDTFLDSWPSSYIRRRSLAKSWDTTGPGIPKDVRFEPTVDLLGNAMAVHDDVRVAANVQFRLNVTADVMRFDLVPKNGRLRLSDGTERNPTETLGGHDYCTRDDGCPPCPGDPSAAPMPRLPGGEMWLAVTGGPAGGAVKVTGRAADCASKPTDSTTVPPGALDPCLVGTWVSTGVRWDAAPGATGGTGIELSIATDRSAREDFSAMQPLRIERGGYHFTVKYNGMATAHFFTDKSMIHQRDADFSGASLDLSIDELGTTEENQPIDGENGPATGNLGYTCSNTELVTTPVGPAAGYTWRRR